MRETCRLKSKFICIGDDLAVEAANRRAYFVVLKVSQNEAHDPDAKKLWTVNCFG